jgi:twitching motility protein PilT
MTTLPEQPRKLTVRGARKPPTAVEGAAPAMNALLHIMVASEASDLHLTSQHTPYLRVHGDVVPLPGYPTLSTEQARELIHGIMPERNRLQFEECGDTDFAYEIPGLARFRANVFLDRLGIGAVLRQIPSRILTADDLNLPKAVREFAHLSKGLVVVTGPTGSGKSTTLAALVDLVNKSRSDHIITIEDPIEFVHHPQRCLINQREVHTHTRTFASALRAALREDPDIVLIGELRDRETVEIALETAETGHLVFGTLHTTTASSTIDRIIDQFPADRQNQIRTMLSSSLKGVVAQTLCKKTSGGRIAALEVLIVTTAVAANIRDGKTFQIASSMQTGRNLGMQMLNDELLRLVKDGTVDAREAHRKAADKADILQKLKSVNLAPADDLEVVQAEAPAAPPPGPDTSDAIVALVAQFREELRQAPDSTDSLNNLAWILSTHPDARLRNGKEAVSLAEHAYTITNGKNPAILDTLSAAYAEAGDFTSAITAATAGLDLALSLGDQLHAQALSSRLPLYEAGTPVRDTF